MQIRAAQYVDIPTREKRNIWQLNSLTLWQLKVRDGVQTFIDFIQRRLCTPEAPKNHRAFLFLSPPFSSCSQVCSGCCGEHWPLSPWDHGDVWLRPCSLLTSEHTGLDARSRWLCLLAVWRRVVASGLCCLVSAGAKAAQRVCVRAVERQQTLVGPQVKMLHSVLQPSHVKVTTLVLQGTALSCFSFSEVQECLFRRVISLCFLTIRNIFSSLFFWRFIGILSVSHFVHWIVVPDPIRV